MLHSPLLAIELDILVLLSVACMSAIALAKLKSILKFPYTVALVILGIGLGWLGENVAGFEFFQQLSLSHDLILFVFVPPLIFESALNLDSRLLLRNLLPILILAAPGLLLSTAIVGAILSWGTPLDLPQALLFGSLISATDPVAVIALFKELGAPKRLGILVEGESLFNDATAIVTFNIILGVIVTGQDFGLPALQQGAIAFLVSFVGGIAVGGLIGFLVQFPISLTKENPLVLATLTTIVAYATFLIAEEVVGVSGVIALVSAGIVLGWYNNNRLRPEARHFVSEFWEYLAFLANSLIFLLVGLTVSRLQFFTQIEQTQDLLGAIALTLVTVLIARAIVVFGLSSITNAIINRSQPTASVPLSYQLISFWGGLRGAVCLALALSFDPDFPNQELMLMLTLGVVLFTLLIPGTTIAALLKKLQLDLPPLFDRLNQLLARILAKNNAFNQLSTISNAFVDPDPAVLTNYQQNRQSDLKQARQDFQMLCEKSSKEFSEDSNLDSQILGQWIWSIVLNLEAQAYQTIYDEGFITEGFLSQLKLMTSIKQDSVSAGQLPPTQAKRRVLEAQLNEFLLTFSEQWVPQQAWVQSLRSQEQSNTYRYWEIIAYTSKLVPIRLQSLFSESGLESEQINTSIENCKTQYKAWEDNAQQQLTQIRENTKTLPFELQTQIAERIAQVSQNSTVSALIKAGVISKSAGSPLLQPVNSSNNNQ
ncbi:MAG: sodium:proton antiporter [Cyanobacteria bacterium J06621_11]